MAASTPNQDQCNEVSKKPDIKSKVHVDIDQHRRVFHGCFGSTKGLVKLSIERFKTVQRFG
jgi:hypothetical protein